MGKQNKAGFAAQRRWTAEDATLALAALSESGLSMNAFSRRHGLSAQRLAWWKKRLAAWSEEPMRLVPAVQPTEASGEARVSVRLGAELVIEVSGAVPAEWLAAVVRELRR
jgi:transposase-like protein